MRRCNLIAAIAMSACLGTFCLADITGKVTLNGKIPVMPAINAINANPDCAKMRNNNPVFEETVVAGKNGELANVVVSIKSPQGVKLQGGKPQPAVLDQQGCVYVPHVVAVQVGQTVVVKNSDPHLHNVHTLPLDNASSNIGMPGLAPPIILGPFTALEVFKVKCDLHPWMAAWVRVLDNPFFAITGKDGTYKIDTTGLPDGEYELTFWHEKYREQTQRIVVKNGKGEANASW